MPVMRFEPTASPIDRIAKALELVHSVYGIKANSAALEKAKTDAARQGVSDERAAEAYDDQRQGVLTAEQRLKLGSDYAIAAEGEKGATPIRTRHGDEIRTEWLKTKEKATDPLLTLIRQQQIEKNSQGTGEQKKIAGFARRLEQAEEVFGGLTEKKYDRSNPYEGLKSLLPGALQSDHLKQQEQAERNFVNAVLRRESGAAISPSEFDSASKQYFPRVGDSPDVLAQKKANREQQIATFGSEAGSALEKTPYVSPLQRIASSKKDRSDGATNANAASNDPVKRVNGKLYKRVKGGWQEVE